MIAFMRSVVELPTQQCSLLEIQSIFQVESMLIHIFYKVHKKSFIGYKSLDANMSVDTQESFGLPNQTLGKVT